MTPINPESIGLEFEATIWKLEASIRFWLTKEGQPSSGALLQDLQDVRALFRNLIKSHEEILAAKDKEIEALKSQVEQLGRLSQIPSPEQEAPPKAPNRADTILIAKLRLGMAENDLSMMRFEQDAILERVQEIRNDLKNIKP